MNINEYLLAISDSEYRIRHYKDQFAKMIYQIVADELSSDSEFMKIENNFYKFIKSYISQGKVCELIAKLKEAKYTKETECKLYECYSEWQTTITGYIFPTKLIQLINKHF